MRVVFYSPKIQGVSGTSSFVRYLIPMLKKYGATPIIVTDIPGLPDYPEFSDVMYIQNKLQPISADFCIYSSIFRNKHNIQAHGYIQMVHTDLHHWNIQYTPDDRDAHVAVGVQVQESLSEFNHIKSIVIPNLIPEPSIRPVMRLMTASRISRGKGFDRMVTLVSLLKNENIPFIWEVYGTGAKLDSLKKTFSTVPEVHFMGAMDNIQSYMVKNDYVVQLSDNEGFCYSIHEALQVGVPVIVTDWKGVRSSVMDGVNGFVLPMNISETNVQMLYRNVELLKSGASKSHLISDLNKEAENSWVNLLGLQSLQK